MLKSTPNKNKVEKKRKDIENGNYSPIKLKKNNQLQNGYITYLILKEKYGEDYLVDVEKEEDISSYKNRPTLYVYGKHPNPKNPKMNKEYVFRVKGNIIPYKDLAAGEYVLVQTKYGLAPLQVTKCEILDRPPIEGRIKIVKRKIIYIDKKRDKVKNL